VVEKETPASLVDSYYDEIAADYHLMYERDGMCDTSRKYPANYFRLQRLLNFFASKDVKKVLEVGVGEGTPLQTLSRCGIEVWGFDISKEMVARAKQRMTSLGLDENRVIWGDIQDPLTYPDLLRQRPFDALIALGVMPHVEKDDLVLENMASFLRPGGALFIEFRNKLFSLFTLNRHTYDFILGDLLKDVDPKLRQDLADVLQHRLNMDVPVPRERNDKLEAPGYDSILAKFHNPFEVIDTLGKHGFRDIRLFPYHYHPTVPWLEQNDRELFRRAAIRLEHETSGWRGLFLCSAFVAEAVKE